MNFVYFLWVLLHCTALCSTHGAFCLMKNNKIWILCTFCGCFALHCALLYPRRLYFANKWKNMCFVWFLWVFCVRPLRCFHPLYFLVENEAIWVLYEFNWILIFGSFGMLLLCLWRPHHFPQCSLSAYFFVLFFLQCSTVPLMALHTPQRSVHYNLNLKLKFLYFYKILSFR